MMNKIQIFEHEKFGRIRTLTIDGEPWFVGIDVAKCLGYSKPNDAISRHVDKDDWIQKKPTNEKSTYQLLLL